MYWSLFLSKVSGFDNFGADYMREIGSLPDHAKKQTPPSLGLVK